MKQPKMARSQCAAIKVSLFAVFCEKSNGRRTLFQRYASRSEADAIARRLRELGCAAITTDGEDLEVEA